MQSNALRSTLAQLVHFLVYVAREFRLFFPVVALSVVVLIFEYIATSLMIPLSRTLADNDGLVVRFWRQVAAVLDVPAAQQTWLWLFLIVMAVRLILGYLQSVAATLLGKRIHQNLSGRIFRHVVTSEPLAAVYRRSVGYYITLAGDDTFRCGTIVSNLLQCAVGFFTAVVALFVLYQFSQSIFFAVFAFLALSGSTTLILLRYLLRQNIRSNALSRELGTYFVESLNSLRSIRSLHGQGFVQKNYAAQIRRYVRILLSIEAVKTAAKSFPAIALLLIAAVLLRPGTPVGFDGGLLFGSTVIVIRVFASLGQFIAAATPLLTDIRAIRDIRSLTSSSDDAVDADDRRVPGATIKNLVLRDVSFSYDGESRVLDSVSFRFEHGRTYAIIGPSGSGKSTLADILLGLVPPQSGKLAANDAALDMDAARGRIMLVEQQPKIFSATLRDNLLFGFEATDEQLWSVLRMVDLDLHFRRMPQGLDTQLTYLGENLSGGQRQRIGIARALIREPDVLLLDEATSALDPVTRIVVVRNIREHMGEGIIIFITHDEEIAKLADAVLLVAKGEAKAPDSPPQVATVASP